jgi:hypothetical protein
MHHRRWRWWRLTSHHCFCFLFPFIRHRRHKQQSKSSLSQSSIIWWPNCGVVEIDSFIIVVCLIQNRRPFSMCVCWWFVSQTLIAFFFITHAHNFIEWSFFSTILNDGKQTNKTRTIESIPFFFSSHFTDFFLDLRRSFFCESIARYMIFTYFIWFSMMTNDQKARQHTIWVENRSIDFFTAYEPSI